MDCDMHMCAVCTGGRTTEARACCAQDGEDEIGAALMSDMISLTSMLSLFQFLRKVCVRACGVGRR
eukprot:2919424-Rhodomonas_salina.1